ncbi:MAG: tetratricopeptide repeat protein [Bacteroidota bacterium]
MRIFRLIFLFLFLTSYQFLIAQKQNTIDSLQLLVNQEKVLNEARVDRLNKLGYLYWIIEPSKSEEYGLEALEIAKILPYPKGQAFANRVIGVAHWARGNIDLSFQFLIKAEELYRSIDDSLGTANSMLNLGMAYADQRNYTSASNKYKQALAFFADLNASSRIATTYTKTADILIQQNQYQEAYNFLIKALEIHKQSNFLYGIAEVNGRLGEISIAKSEYNDAISYFLIAIEAAKQRNDNVGRADYYHGVGLAFYRKKDYEQAFNYLDLAKSLAEEYDLKKIQRRIYDTYKNLETTRGNYQAAITYYDQYLRVRDELFNEEKSNIISNMESKRAYEEKEQQLEIAQKNLDLLLQKNKTSNRTKLALVFGILASLSLGWGILQRQNRQLEQQQVDLLKAEKETDELKDTIQQKEQVLTSYTLNFVQKNEFISDLKTAIQGLKSELSREQRPKLNAIAKKIDTALRMDEDWDDFRKHFESVHPKLIKKLNQDFPKLTKNEFKLIALVRLNLSTKEISSILGISPDSVKTARYRLRKKLRLENHNNLFDFLINYDQVVKTS